MVTYVVVLGVTTDSGGRFAKTLMRKVNRNSASSADVIMILGYVPKGSFSTLIKSLFRY
jgi:hypothetical protein